MSFFKRNQITNTGMPPMAEKFLNDNFANLFSKISGNINFSDVDTNVQNQIKTQWFPFSDNGNLDSTHPLVVRFYIPNNVKEFKEAKLSATVSNFRMDSSVANSMAVPVSLDLLLSVEEAGVMATSTAATDGSLEETFPVFEWGTSPYSFAAPTKYIGIGSDIEKPSGAAPSGGFVTATQNSRTTLGTIHGNGKYAGFDTSISDFMNFQHTHEVIIPSHTHIIHTSTQKHSHTGTAMGDLPAHTHPLNEGIKDSATPPRNVRILMDKTLENGTIQQVEIGKRMGEGFTYVLSDADFLDCCKTGWNTITVKADSIAHIDIFGVVELVQEFYPNSN